MSRDDTTLAIDATPVHHGRGGAPAVKASPWSSDMVRSSRRWPRNKLDDGFDASPALVDGEILLRGYEHLYSIAETP